MKGKRTCRTTIERWRRQRCGHGTAGAAARTPTTEEANCDEDGFHVRRNEGLWFWFSLSSLATDYQLSSMMTNLGEFRRRWGSGGRPRRLPRWPHGRRCPTCTTRCVGDTKSLFSWRRRKMLRWFLMAAKPSCRCVDEEGVGCATFSVFFRKKIIIKGHVARSRPKDWSDEPKVLKSKCLWRTKGRESVSYFYFLVGKFIIIYSFGY